MAHHGAPQTEGSKAAYPEQNYSPGAKWIKHLTKNRIGGLTGGHFADVNLSSVLFTHRVDNSSHVKLQVWSAPGLSKPTFQEAMKHNFKPAKKGDSFGPSCESPPQSSRVAPEAMCHQGCAVLSLFIDLPAIENIQTNHWWKVSVNIPAYWQQYERVQCKQASRRFLLTDGTRCSRV